MNLKYLQVASLSALLLHPLSVAGQLNLTDRGCSRNDTVLHVSNTTYETLNASGSVQSKGIDIGQNENPASWTWSTGVQLLFNSSRVFQPIWVDTKGTDLAAQDLGYEMCYMAMTGHTSAVQRRGQGDPGDCTKFLSQACIEDWTKKMTLQAGIFRSNVSTQSPCSELVGATPESCKEFGGGFQSNSRVPNLKRNCSLGLGDPDYDLVAVLIARNDNEKGEVDPADFNAYDTVATRIVPFFFLAWTTSTDSPRSAEARIMCLSSPNVTESSRKPPGVPSIASRTKMGQLWVIISLLAGVWSMF